jgi:alpha-tubulin suppressor-like RCC1 family protein
LFLVSTCLQTDYQSQLGIQQDSTTFDILKFPYGKKVARIFAGPYHSMFLTTENELYVAGESYTADSSSTIHLEKLVENVQIDQLAAGWHLSVAITKCGRILFMGENRLLSDEYEPLTKRQFLLSHNAVAISHGYARVAVTNEGAIIWFTNHRTVKRAFPLQSAWLRNYDCVLKTQW